MSLFDFKLAWWQLRGQSSRAWLFVFCVAIGVTARVSVGSFMGQVSRAVNREARSLLTADLEVASTKPISAQHRTELQSEAGPAARFQDRAAFLSVLSAGARGLRHSRLCQVTAVDLGYPFYGKLRVGLSQGREIAGNMDFLNAGEATAIVAPELLLQLGIHIGDALRVGRMDFRVAGVIVEEPGLGSGAFSLGPRVFIGLRHLKETGLVGFGSMVSYATLVALPAPEMAAPLAERLKAMWKIKVDPKLPGPPPTDSLRVRTFKDAEENLQRFFVRLTDFLNLAALMALLLGGIGVASVVRAFVRHQYGDIGVLRTLGSSGNRIARVYLLQCLGLGFMGSILGVVTGTALQNMLPWVLKDFLPMPLTFGVDLKSCAMGMLLGILTSALFSLLPIMEIRLAHPAQIFRDEVSERGGGWRFWSLAIFGALLFTLIGAWEAHSMIRGGGFIGALIVGALLIWLFSLLALPWLAKLRIGGTGLRHGFSNLSRPGLRPSAAVIALGCAALHLGIIAIYQGSLLTELDPGKRLDEIPGLFLIDIQSDQVEDIRGWLQGKGKPALVFSPMIKARYKGKNGEEADAKQNWSREDEDDHQMRSREQNLSFRRDLGQGEEVVKGQWMNPDSDELQASLEEGYADRLGVKLGDRLSFDVQGVLVEAKVTSLRKVHWASFQPNFFVLLSPWALQNAPMTWIGSVAGLKDDERETIQTELVEKFPNVTVFDVAEGSRKIMGIMDKISWAIRIVALFSIFTGLVVLIGIALSTARSRRQEAALLKTLGAGRGVILASLGAEFGSLGFLSGLFGLGLSTIFGWILLEKDLEIPFYLPYRELMLLLSGMVLLCALTGMLSSLRAIRIKPLAVLREE